MVMIHAKASDWSSTVNSDPGGNFVFNAVPLGEYVVTVAGVGFEQSRQDVMVSPVRNRCCTLLSAWPERKRPWTLPARSKLRRPNGYADHGC